MGTGSTKLARIAIDIDSTLYDFALPLRQAFLDLALDEGDKETYFKGGYQSWVEWRSPTDVCGYEAFQKALNIVHSPEVIRSQIPFEGASKVVKRLCQEGHEVYFLSNRSNSKETVYATEQWIDENIVELDSTDAYWSVTCTLHDKSKYLVETDCLIDDRPKTLVEFIYKYGPRGAKAFGLMYEYNRALTDIPNIYLAPTWRGLEYYLEAKGILHG
jgi:5'(3')-deoxyribonucleotidase